MSIHRRDCPSCDRRPFLLCAPHEGEGPAPPLLLHCELSFSLGSIRGRTGSPFSPLHRMRGKRDPLPPDPSAHCPLLLARASRESWTPAAVGFGFHRASSHGIHGSPSGSAPPPVPRRTPVRRQGPRRRPGGLHISSPSGDHRRAARRHV
ncbi:hypothetical protein VPH35_129274 [Triticum aestivum]